MNNPLTDRLDFLSGPVEKLGCDWNKVKAVLDLQLTLDARRKTTSRKKNAKERGIFQTMAMMYGISGLFTALIVLSVPDSYVRVSLGFFFVFLMSALIMITDFSAIILDHQGQLILQTKPIDQKSLHVAKLLHIFVYMSFMTLILGLPLMALVIWRDGLQGALICLLAYLGMDLITVSFTAFLYALLLRMFSGEKLRDMIQTLQVGVMIIMVLSYQVFNQGIELVGATARLSPAWWHLILPSQWYASWMAAGSTPVLIALRTAGLVLPLILLVAYLKLLAPRFDSMLYRFDENKETMDLKKLERSMKLQKFLASLFTRSTEERSGFLFGFRLLKRERKVQLIVIPQLALGVIFPLIFLIPALIRGTSLEEIRSMPFYYSLLMSGFMVVPMGLYGMKSEYYQAAWIFDTLPVQDPCKLKRGMMKSFFIRYQLPVLLVPTLILSGVYGWRSMPEIFSIFFLLCFFARLNHRSFGTDYPFSEDVAAIQENRARMTGMLFMNLGFLLLIGAAHSVLILYFHAVWLVLPVSLALAVLAWESNGFLKKEQRNKIQRT